MTTPEDTNITLLDLQFIVNYIDMTVERGALKGNEILEVGNKREKFINFLRVAQEQQQNNNNTTLSNNSGE